MTAIVMAFASGLGNSMMTDRVVAVVTVICAAFTLNVVVLTLGYVASNAGDVGALAMAIGGVLTAAITVWAKFKGGRSDGG